MIKGTKKESKKESYSMAYAYEYASRGKKEKELAVDLTVCINNILKTYDETAKKFGEMDDDQITDLAVISTGFILKDLQKNGIIE